LVEALAPKRPLFRAVAGNGPYLGHKNRGELRPC